MRPSLESKLQLSAREPAARRSGEGSKSAGTESQKRAAIIIIIIIIISSGVGSSSGGGGGGGGRW